MQRSITEWAIKTKRSDESAPATSEAPRFEGEAVLAASTAREQPARGDDVQDFVDFFVNISEHPKYKNTELQARRVAVFGNKYYWGEEVTHSMATLPKSFRRWCAHNKFQKFNTVLVNVYPTAKSNIGWHADNTTRLASGEVASISFAINKEDRGKVLARMEFREPSKADATKKRLRSTTLGHGSCIRFDAFKHARRKMEHRVAKTDWPRVNVTLRHVNNA